MRRFINCLLICSLSVIVACGYRTAPVPYSQPEEGLPSVNRATLNRQGDNWVFRWQLNKDQKTVQQSTKTPAGEADPGSAKTFEKSAIKQFRINIHRKIEECAACDAETIGHLLVDLTRHEVLSVLPDGATPPDNPYFYMAPGQGFRLNLPQGFFRDNGFIDNCYYTIDYLLHSGLLSMGSPGILPADLTPVPLPTVRVTKKIINLETRFRVPHNSIIFSTVTRILAGGSQEDSGCTLHPAKSRHGRRLFPLMPKTEADSADPILKTLVLDNGCAPPPPMDYFLLLEWEPQQEALRHTLQKDGKFSEEVIHYGLNLYRTPVTSSQPGKTETTTRVLAAPPHLVNSAPLLYGSFSLLNFQGRLSVRQVDRHGNESESVIVFDGHY